jgi:hypothetical protein
MQILKTTTTKKNQTTEYTLYLIWMRPHPILDWILYLRMSKTGGRVTPNRMSPARTTSYDVNDSKTHYSIDKRVPK